MSLIRNRKFLTGLMVCSVLTLGGSRSHGGLITELPSHFQLVDPDSTPHEESQPVEIGLPVTGSVASEVQRWEGQEAPWIKIASPLDETGHGARFGGMLVGDAPEMSHSVRRGGRGGGNSGSGGGGRGGARASGANPGFVQNGTTRGEEPSAPGVTPPATGDFNQSPSLVASTPASSGAFLGLPGGGTGLEPANEISNPIDQPLSTGNPFSAGQTSGGGGNYPFPVGNLVAEAGSPPGNTSTAPGLGDSRQSTLFSPADVEIAAVAPPILFLNPEPGSLILLLVGATIYFLRRCAFCSSAE